MVAPIQLIRGCIGSMRHKGWGRIINITSGAVKSPLTLLGLSNGARSGLTGFVAGLAREVARDRLTINNLLPGNFATDRLQSYVSSLAASRNVSEEAAWAGLRAAIPAGRVGEPHEFCATCAFLCSNHAGFLTGQNILLDGGAYPGVM
jgi:3-oxoacyl-[acyl-carrier protein] reductase